MTRALARTLLACLCGALFVPPPCVRAQGPHGSYDITLFGGGYFGDQIYSGTTPSGEERDAEVGDTGVLGARLAVNLSRQSATEFSYSRSTAAVDLRGKPGLPKQKIGDLTEDHYDLNVNFGLNEVDFGQPVIAYVTVGAGVTHFGLEVPGVGNGGSTRFSSNLGLGARGKLSDRLLVRADARWHFTWTDVGGEYTWCNFYGCYTYEGQTYAGGQVTAGLTYRLLGK